MATTNLTTHGFTGQEEMDSICAVNLNARIYDPTLGKFLSADPIVGTPFDLQQLNRYTYVLNNPLSLTDPSGLCFLGCFWNRGWFWAGVFLGPQIWLAEATKNVPIIGTIFTIAAGVICGPPCAAAEAGINAGIQSGKIGIGLKAFVLTFSEAVAFNAVGSFVDNLELPDATTHIPTVTPFEAGALRVVLHGVVGGTFSAANGGNFGSGFLAAGVSELASPYYSSNNYAGTAEAAVVGGFASALVAGNSRTVRLQGHSDICSMISPIAPELDSVLQKKRVKIGLEPSLTQHRHGSRMPLWQV